MNALIRSNLLEGDLADPALPQVSHLQLGTGFSAEAGERLRLDLVLYLSLKASAVLPTASETGICLALQVFSYDVERNNTLKVF